jgi:hypothetical protein
MKLGYEINIKQSHIFKHYFDMLNMQCIDIASYRQNERIDYILNTLNNADKKLMELKNSEVKMNDDRVLRKYISPTMEALSRFKKEHKQELDLMNEI